MGKLILPESGNVLLSAPFLGDVFKRSVILLAEHNEEGSVGFILNKPTGYKLNEVLSDFSDVNNVLYNGGPVQPEILNFISNKDFFPDVSFKISDGIFWNGDYEELKYSILNNQINPDEVKFFLGYTGWGPGQLISEIESGSWYVTNPASENIFDHRTSNLWSNILKSMGNEYAVISSFPDDPSVN